MMMKSYHRHLTMCGRAQERMSLFVRGAIAMSGVNSEEELSENLVQYITERKSRPVSDRPVDQGTRADSSANAGGCELRRLWRRAMSLLETMTNL